MAHIWPSDLRGPHLPSSLHPTIKIKPNSSRSSSFSPHPLPPNHQAHNRSSDCLKSPPPSPPSSSSRLQLTITPIPSLWSPFPSPYPPRAKHQARIRLLSPYPLILIPSTIKIVSGLFGISGPPPTHTLLIPPYLPNLHAYTPVNPPSPPARAFFSSKA